jgi:NaMN:DMB phosphoribosyltransferase
VVREGVGAGGEMNQALYAHMNNKRKMKTKQKD